MSENVRDVECTIPVLPVSNLQRSLTFYTETRGFKLAWRGQIIGSVSRDGRSIMLSEFSGNPGGGWVWIGVEDDSLFDEYLRKGVKVLQKPENHVWAYEMKFEDPDGNVLWLGTESRKDLPLDDE